MQIRQNFFIFVVFCYEYFYEVVKKNNNVK